MKNQTCNNIFDMSDNFRSKNMLNIFDGTDVSDLPPDVQKEISPLHRGTYSFHVRELFKIKNTLHVDEIIIAYYRQHKHKLERKKAQEIVNNLTIQKILKRVDVNTYQLIREV
jgi:hypothetical protein